MNVKTVLFMAATPALIATLTGTSGATAATITNNSGTICKNYFSSDVGYIDYVTMGTRSLKSGAQGFFICPLVRSTTSSAGATVYVDVYHGPAGGNSGCTLYSYGYGGNALGSVYQTWTRVGFHEFALTLGAGTSDTWSDYSVLCGGPSSATGWDGMTIMGVDLVEY